MNKKTIMPLYFPPVKRKLSGIISIQKNEKKESFSFTTGVKSKWQCSFLSNFFNRKTSMKDKIKNSNYQDF